MITEYGLDEGWWRVSRVVPYVKINMALSEILISVDWWFGTGYFGAAKACLNDSRKSGRMCSFE